MFRGCLDWKTGPLFLTRDIDKLPVLEYLDVSFCTWFNDKMIKYLCETIPQKQNLRIDCRKTLVSNRSKKFIKASKIELISDESATTSTLLF